MRKTLKWTGIVVGSLLGVLLLGILGLYAAGQMRLNKVYEVPFRTVALPEDAESLAEGKRIFQYRGCEACHGEDLEGLVYMDNPALGKVITPNLTTGPGGIGDERTDEDLVRAIQHGIRPDGTPLLFMPSTEFYYLSDADLGRVLAYIRSMPPVDNDNTVERTFIHRVRGDEYCQRNHIFTCRVDSPRRSAPHCSRTRADRRIRTVSCPVVPGLPWTGTLGRGDSRISLGVAGRPQPDLRQRKPVAFLGGRGLYRLHPRRTETWPRHQQRVHALDFVPPHD